MADSKTTPAPDPVPVLDIATLIERPRIKIDDGYYDILSPDELSVLDHQRFGAWGRRLDALLAKPRLTKAEEKELGALLRTISDKVMVGVPDDVRAKLTESHRLSVSEVFTQLPLQRQMKALMAPDQAAGAKPTGEKPQPGSSASSAATPAGGSRARRSRSSART